MPARALGTCARSCHAIESAFPFPSPTPAVALCERLLRTPSGQSAQLADYRSARTGRRFSSMGSGLSDGKVSRPSGKIQWRRQSHLLLDGNQVRSYFETLQMHRPVSVGSEATRFDRLTCSKLIVLQISLSVLCIRRCLGARAHFQSTSLGSA